MTREERDALRRLCEAQTYVARRELAVPPLTPGWWQMSIQTEAMRDVLWLLDALDAAEVRATAAPPTISR